MLKSKKPSPRSLDLHRLATELGMAYSHKDEFHDIRLLRYFRLYKNTSASRRMEDILSRSYGLLDSKVMVFDLHWTVSNGKTTQRFVQTTFFMQSKLLKLPAFYLRPETFVQRIGAWLGMQDIDFEAYPQFSASNLLQGPDEEAIRSQLVSPEFAGVFQINKDWYLEGMGYYFLLYRYKKKLPVHEIKGLLSKGAQLFHIIRSKSYQEAPET
jgi:hypothetical protein